jgi:hypothetical protein
VRRHTGAAPSEVRFRDSERGRIALVSIVLPASNHSAQPTGAPVSSNTTSARAGQIWPAWSCTRNPWTRSALSHEAPEPLWGRLRNSGYGVEVSFT